MKIDKIFKNIANLAVFLSLLFCNFLLINGATTTLFDMVIGGVIFVLIPAIAIFVCLFLDVFPIKNRILRNASLIVFLLSSVILILVPNIYELLGSEATIQGGYIVTVTMLILAVIFKLRKCFEESYFGVKDIVEIGIFVALAIVLDLSFFKIRIGQNGGSISLSMVPLFMLCYRKGFIKGFLSCGIIYGLITCALDGYGFVTYPLDYLLAYGSIGLAGIFSKQVVSGNKITFKNYLFLFISIIVAAIGRTLFATISGIVVYKLDFLSSLIYQLSYLTGSFIGSAIILILLLHPLQRKLHK